MVIIGVVVVIDVVPLIILILVIANWHELVSALTELVMWTAVALGSTALLAASIGIPLAVYFHRRNREIVAKPDNLWRLRIAHTTEDAPYSITAVNGDPSTLLDGVPLEEYFRER